MYPITSTVKNLFDNNVKQVIRITCNPVSGASFTLDENDIISGSFSIDRYSITGQRIEVGTAVAAEMTFRIKNYSGEWTGKKFEGCEMYVRIGIADWTTNPTEQQINFIPCGYFTVDKPVKNAQILEIVALDRMAKFDRLVDKNSLAVSYTPKTLVNYVCTQCGVVLANGSAMSNFVNADYVVQIPDNVEELTYRNLLQSACMLMGVNAFIDWNGQLYLKWYESVTVTTSEAFNPDPEGEGWAEYKYGMEVGYNEVLNVITMDGEPERVTDFEIMNVQLSPGSYTLSGMPTGYASAMELRNGNTVYRDSGSGVSFTLSNTTTFTLYIKILAVGITFNNIYFTPSCFGFSSSGLTYDKTMRYSHTIHENDVEVTGIVYEYVNDNNETVRIVSGTDDYAIDISENPLIKTDTASTAISALAGELIGFTYRPLTMATKPSPYIYPMDGLAFITAEKTAVYGIVSKVTFGINSRTAIESIGETAEDSGYASYGQFTEIQTKIIEKMKKPVSNMINDRTALLINMNDMLANSLGLYAITVPIQGGGVQYYFADNPTLADATIIYTFNANGFAWTDDWNDGQPVWQTGITRDGNAVINMLSAYKISADYITAGTMSAVNLIFGETPNTTELRTNNAKTGALFEGQGVMQFQTKGEFYAQNINASGNTVANSIRLRANVTNSGNVLNITNQTASGVRANSLNMTCGTISNLTMANFDNNNTNIEANRIEMNSTTDSSAVVQQNFMRLANNALGANDTANYIYLRNSYTADESSIIIVNNDRNGTTLRNKFKMIDNSSGQEITIENYQGQSTLRNRFRSALVSNVPVTGLYNYDTANTEIAKIELDGYDLRVKCKKSDGTASVGYRVGWVVADGHIVLGAI